MNAHSIIVATLLSFTATCNAAETPNTATNAAEVARLLHGTFDNRAQIADAAAGNEATIPHVVVTIDPTPQRDFSLWHVHLETGADAAFDQTWAMQTRIEHDGTGALVPYYQLKQDAPPSAAAFDVHEWLSL